MPSDDRPTPAHCRPAGVTDETVEALGKLSEALETVERVRGHLYSMHQLTGKADFLLDFLQNFTRFNQESNVTLYVTGEAEIGMSEFAPPL